MGLVVHSHIAMIGGYMGLLDSLLGKITGGSGSGVEGGIANALIGILSSKSSGGLPGLVDGLTKNGLGDIVSSWVGTGSNLPISADQIVKGLGSDQISQLASKVGISPDMVTSSLAKVLPDLVDKLTPGGKIPTDDLLQQGLKMLKGKL